MSGHTDRSDLRSPEKVSDIWITPVYQIECADHGVVDEPRTFAEAIAARRDHWFGVHKGQDVGQPPFVPTGGIQL